MSDRPLNVGVIGFGNHVVKNILRVFPDGGARRIAAIHVRRPEALAGAHPAYAERFTGSLEAMLTDPAIDVVYIATPISTHFEFASAALKAGKHVWCEKPLTASLADTRVLSELAQARGLQLAEVAMYQHHAQFAWVRALLQEKAATGERLIDARARFTIPELPATDIRYRRDLGGGALLDVGFYPLSAAVALFGPPSAVAAVGHRSRALGVDLSGSALLSYDGFACHGLWAIGCSYANEMELSFERSAYVVPRAFAKPADLVTEVRVTGPFGQAADPVSIPADDQFEVMFTAFAHAIHAGDRAAFAVQTRRAVANAAVIDAVRDAMGEAP